MANKLPNMTLKAIGVVHNEVKQMPPGRHDWFVEIISEIVIDSSLTEALNGLEAFSHIIVLYWIHRLVSGELPIKHHPQGREGNCSPSGTE